VRPQRCYLHEVVGEHGSCDPQLEALALLVLELLQLLLLLFLELLQFANLVSLKASGSFSRSVAVPGLSCSAIVVSPFIDTKIPRWQVA
jgi:hypothetical protein